MKTKGWPLRLFILLSVGWVAWFAYQAYDANRQFVSATGYIQIYVYDQRGGRPSAYDVTDLIRWQNEEATRGATAVKTMAAGLVVGMIAILTFGWVQKGWKSRPSPKNPLLEKRAEEMRESRRMARFRPASTPLLVGSILILPMLWQIDCTAMANFWIARIKG